MQASAKGIQNPSPNSRYPRGSHPPQPLHLELESLLQLFLLLIQGIFQSLLCCFFLLELAEQVQNLKESWNKQVNSPKEHLASKSKLGEFSCHFQHNSTLIYLKIDLVLRCNLLI